MKKYMIIVFMVIAGIVSTACEPEDSIQLKELKLHLWQNESEPLNSWIFEADSCFEYFEADQTFAASYEILLPDTAIKPYLFYFFGDTKQFYRIDTLNTKKLVLFHIESLNALEFTAKPKDYLTK